jgi:hypothetical protein
MQVLISTSIFQYSENNVIYLSFSLLRIKGLYMFRALFAHPRKAFHKRHLYIACVLRQLVAPGLEWNTQWVQL